MRGAPAIAIVALLGISVEINKKKFDGKQEFFDFINERSAHLCSARPTAVNIKKETDDIIQMVHQLLQNDSVTLESAIQSVYDAIERVLSDDLAVNRAIGDAGADFLLQDRKPDEKLVILTHCNTGSLATSGYGTALGVIRSLHLRNRLEAVYCTETRPFNQGSRLTAWELVEEKMNGILICDSMAAALMKQKKVDAVIVGADRVVANGDTANKIGTYQLAVVAKAHEVPFLVAAPLSSVDFNLTDGSDVPIEERPHHEMKQISGIKLAPDAIKCWNPAFDVTPAHLITRVVTEKGTVEPQNLRSHRVPSS